jgi:hypothetical protein
MAAFLVLLGAVQRKRQDGVCAGLYIVSLVIGLRPDRKQSLLSCNRRELEA